MAERAPVSPRHNYTVEPKPRRRIEDDGEIDSDYVVGEVLGKGAFGVVKEATSIVTGEKYAIKQVLKDKPGSTAIQLLEREVAVLSTLQHPHVIQLVEVYETPKKVFMVLEMCRGGELSDLLHQKYRLNEEEVKIVMRRLAEAVVYMHDCEVVHRDLKLENILVSTADPDDTFNIKVTDFGLSHAKGLPGCDDLMSNRCGTLYYMAPEVVKSMHEYSKLCDVWSMGVIMYNLLCGKMPFNGETADELQEAILNANLGFTETEWITIGEGAKDLIRGMLHVNTISRLTARQVLEDPWITGEAERKRIDPFKMLMDDSPFPSPQVRRAEHTSLTPTQPMTSKSMSLLAPPLSNAEAQIRKSNSTSPRKTSGMPLSGRSRTDVAHSKSGSVQTASQKVKKPSSARH